MKYILMFIWAIVCLNPCIGQQHLDDNHTKELEECLRYKISKARIVTHANLLRGYCPRNYAEIKIMREDFDDKLCIQIEMNSNAAIDNDELINCLTIHLGELKKKQMLINNNSFRIELLFDSEIDIANILSHSETLMRNVLKNKLNTNSKLSEVKLKEIGNTVILKILDLLKSEQYTRKELEYMNYNQVLVLFEKELNTNLN